MDQSLHINIKPFTYQCSSKIKPSMLMVEVSLGCMVTVVSKLIVLDQKGQIPKLTLKQFGRVTGIAENKQKSIFIQKTMGLNMYMGIFIIKPFADKFYFISLCNSHYSWHQTGG